MTNCIRCGAEIEFNEPAYMFMTADGGYSCPSSLPGEAAVHRAGERLNTQRPSTLKRVAVGAVKGYLGFKGGQLAAAALFHDPSANVVQELSDRLGPIYRHD